MNRLKEFLQVEVRNSYKYAIAAQSSIKTIERCLIDLDLYQRDENFDNNFAAAEITIESLIEKMEEYLKIDA